LETEGVEPSSLNEKFPTIYRLIRKMILSPA
jgi:hypothetical protein